MKNLPQGKQECEDKLYWLFCFGTYLSGCLSAPCPQWKGMIEKNRNMESYGRTNMHLGCTEAGASNRTSQSSELTGKLHMVRKWREAVEGRTMSSARPAAGKNGWGTSTVNSWKDFWRNFSWCRRKLHSLCLVHSSFFFLQDTQSYH